MSMQDVKVSSGSSVDKREVSVQFDVPEDYASAVERWGEKPVFGCFVARLVVKVQDGIRNSVLKPDTYDPSTAQGLAQAEADGFLLDAPRAARAVKMPDVDAYVAHLLTKHEAGTITEKEQLILEAATS